MSLVTPVDVSLWTTATAFMARSSSAASIVSMVSASTPCRQSPRMKSTSSPSFRARAGLHHQDPIPRRERIHQSGLPGTRSRRGKDDHRTRAVEHLLEPFEKPVGHLPKLWAAVIDGGLIDGPQHPVGNIAGARNLQELTTGFRCHGFCFFFVSCCRPGYPRRCSRYRNACTGATITQ